MGWTSGSPVITETSSAHWDEMDCRVKHYFAIQPVYKIVSRLMISGTRSVGNTIFFFKITIKNKKQKNKKKNRIGTKI